MAEPEEIINSGSIKEKSEEQNNNMINNEELFPDEISEVQHVESDLNSPLIEPKNLENFPKDEISGNLFFNFFKFIFRRTI